MKTPTRIVSWALALGMLATLLPAQGEDSGAAAPPVEVQGRLTPRSPVVVSGEPMVVALRVFAPGDCLVDAAVLAGLHLEIELVTPLALAPASQPEAVVLGAAAGERVGLAAGTTVERLLTFAMPVNVTTGLARVVVTWPGLPGATASIEVAPAQKDIDVDQLDLARTRVLLITNHGGIELSMFPEAAPNHVRNFVKLAASGFYDGTRFHRVERGFVIQGGCPNTREGATGMPGTGSPGYTIDAEFGSVSHVRGVLSMARGPEPNSAGSQFFICHGDASFLDGRYSAFGRVESGLDTVDKIAEVPVVPKPDGGKASVPVQPVHLYRAIVLPAAAKK